MLLVVCLRVCVSVFAYVCVHLCMFVHLCVCVCVVACVCVQPLSNLGLYFNSIHRLGLKGLPQVLHL